MAAVASVDPRLVSPPGETVIDKGYASVDILRGQPVVITSTTPPSRRWEQVIGLAAGTEAVGFALKDCAAGGTVEYASQGEMDGFTGLTRGASLTIVGGALDTTTAAAGTARIRAVTTSRIRFNLI